MKRIISSSLLLAALVVAFTGCLKDKGFDNRTYGINDPDTQPPGVGFPLAASTKNTVGLDAGVATNQAINNVVFVNLETGTAAKSDVHVTLVLNDALRTAYNTANGTSILAFPAAQYNVALNVLIPAGATGGQVAFNIPSTVPLDPSNSYGVGLTISSVDGGYLIAKNLKDLFLEFTLKNKYDGNYKLDLNSQGWAAYGIASDANFYTWGSNGDGTSIFMITGGPNNVRLYDEWGFGTFIQPAFTTGGGSATGFGATAPRFTFNTATDQLIDVSNDTPDDGRGRKFKINPAVVPPAGNFWNPSTRKILASYIMQQNGRPDQFLNAIFTYRSPRP